MRPSGSLALFALAHPIRLDDLSSELDAFDARLFELGLEPMRADWER